MNVRQALTGLRRPVVLAGAQAGSTAFRGREFGDATDMADLAAQLIKMALGTPKQFVANGIFRELMGKSTKACTVGAR